MTSRRDAKAVDSPLAPPVPGGRPLLPDEFRSRPLTGSIAEISAWRARRRAWFADNGLLNDRGVMDWSRVDRGPRCCPDLVVMGATPPAVRSATDGQDQP